jgi:hypothetical protein
MNPRGDPPIQPDQPPLSIISTVGHAGSRALAEDNAQRLPTPKKISERELDSSLRVELIFFRPKPTRFGSRNNYTRITRKGTPHHGYDF